MNARTVASVLLLMGLMLGAINTDLITWMVVAGSLQLIALVGAAAAISGSFSRRAGGTITAPEAAAQGDQ